jgi:hypothetical protein
MDSESGLAQHLYAQLLRLNGRNLAANGLPEGQFSAAMNDSQHRPSSRKFASAGSFGSPSGLIGKTPLPCSRTFRKPKEIVDLHGGSIAVLPRTEEERRGASFTIQLPLIVSGGNSLSGSAM